MALVTCGECGREVSDRAVACPNCGNPTIRPGATQASVAGTTSASKNAAQRPPKKPVKRAGCGSLLLVCVIGLVVIIILGGVQKKTGTNTGAANSSGAAPSTPVDDPKTKISPEIFKADDKSDFPQLAKKLGSAWPRLQPSREAAAIRAASSEQCDYVEVAEASDKSTKSNIVFFVDCRNGERLYVSEQDLKSKANSVFQSDKVIDQSTAIEACSNAAKSMTTHPELANMHTWSGASFNANKSTGNALVTVDFEAKNLMGVEGKFTARCIFPADGQPPEINVLPRS